MTDWFLAEPSSGRGVLRRAAHRAPVAVIAAGASVGNRGSRGIVRAMCELYCLGWSGERPGETAMVIVLKSVPSVSLFASTFHFFTANPARLGPLHLACRTRVGIFWPKASSHRSLGQRPRNGSTTRCLAEGHIHTWEPMPQVSLAFSQTCFIFRFPGALPQATVNMAFGQLRVVTASRYRDGQSMRIGPSMEQIPQRQLAKTCPAFTFPRSGAFGRGLN